MKTIDRSTDVTIDRLMAGMSIFREVPDWLREPLQEDIVSEALRQQVPEFHHGTSSLLRVKAKRLFLQDTRGIWEGTYLVKMIEGGTGQEKEIRLHGSVTAPWLAKPPGESETGEAFGSPRWRVFVPELNLALEPEAPEVELPSLPLLLDPEQARLLLERTLHTSGGLPSSVSVTGCSVNVLSYKPGSRCTILYTLTYSEPAADCPPCYPAVIAKIYRKASKAQNAYEGMLTLWNSPLSSEEVVTISRPLGFMPEHKTMIQSIIPGGQSQEDLLLSYLNHPTERSSQSLYRSIQKTAAGLAAFHQSGARYGNDVGIEGRFAVIEDLTNRLEVVFPDIRQHITPLVEFLKRVASGVPAGDGVPSHGTFNPEQVMLTDEGEIGFIDFDNYCMAEPAMDVGQFRVAVKDTGMNALDPTAASDDAVRGKRLALLTEIGDTFLNEYQAHAPLQRERVALWEAMEVLRNVLHTWIKVKPEEPDHAWFTLGHILRRSMVET